MVPSSNDSNRALGKVECNCRRGVLYQPGLVFLRTAGDSRPYLALGESGGGGPKKRFSIRRRFGSFSGHSK